MCFSHKERNLKRVFNPFDALGFLEWMLPFTIESGLVYIAINIVCNRNMFQVYSHFLRGT